jgi:hypothetical protein
VPSPNKTNKKPFFENEIATTGFWLGVVSPDFYIKSVKNIV